jgi:hypothetical protein
MTLIGPYLYRETRFEVLPFVYCRVIKKYLEGEDLMVTQPIQDLENIGMAKDYGEVISSPMIMM